MYLLHPRNYFQVESEKNDSIFLTSILFPTTITQRKGTKRIGKIIGRSSNYHFKFQNFIITNYRKN